MSSTSPTASVTVALRSVYRAMSPRRRRHLFLSIALMVMGAFAELATIGAILPFLSLITNPDRPVNLPVLRFIFDKLGWRGEGLIVRATLLLVCVVVVATAIRLTLTWVSQKFVFRLGHDIGV